MSRYLYGASVQGIQEFIFATNKLKEIVGASELVKQIAEDFKKFNPDVELVNAAGNIKAIFNSKEKCQKAVLEFSKKIQQKAYGITISQAVVDMSNPKYSKQNDAIQELEKRLKVQRNRPSIALDNSINIMKLNPSTAKPVTKHIIIQKKETLIDKATEQKRDAFPKDSKFQNISDLSNDKNKIAVIHADGNGLGTIIPELGDKLSSFSIKLNIATTKAYEDSIRDDMKIRKVVLGGDDMTVICDANIALEFTRNFLENFEKETSKIEELKGIREKLTACAGVAYTNEKYPFHYAVSLAEELCSQTKKHAKDLAKKLDKKLAPSSLMFHNIQSSNYQSWDKFVKDELTINSPVKGEEKETIRLDFGAYYLDEPNQPHIDKLQISVEAYRCDGSPISRLRNWMSELYKSKKYADDLLARINDITQQSGKWNCKIMDRNLENLYSGLSDSNIILEKDGYKKTPIYDILQLLSVTEAKQ